jgi:hypothetical protein
VEIAKYNATCQARADEGIVELNAFDKNNRFLSFVDYTKGQDVILTSVFNFIFAKYNEIVWMVTSTNSIDVWSCFDGNILLEILWDSYMRAYNRGLFFSDRHPGKPI